MYSLTKMDRKTQKGQTSLEYVLIVVAAVVIILIVLYWLFANSDALNNAANNETVNVRCGLTHCTVNAQCQVPECGGSSGTCNTTLNRCMVP